MTELSYDEIEKIIGSVASRIDHKASPEAKQALVEIKELSRKLDEHIKTHEADTKKLNDRFDPESNHYILKDVQDIITAYKGSKILGEFLKWTAGIGIAYLVVKGFVSPR